jgi:uncharacterized protein YhdP
VLEQVRLNIPDLDADDPVLDISGRVNASIGELLDYVQASPVHGLIGGATDGMTGTGKAGVRMALHIPLNHSVNTTVKGELGLEASRLELGPGRPALTGLAGKLLFTERGVSSPALTGNLLGGAARASISSQPGGIVRIEASGRARIASLAQQFPLRAWSLASGDTAWRGDISIAPTSTRILVQSNLEGVTLDLPAPLHKLASQSQPLRFLWQSGERGDRYEVDIGSQVRARVQTRSGGRAAGSTVEQALVAVGGAALPAARQRGVGFAADLPQFFATQWLPVIDRFTAAGIATFLAGTYTVTADADRMGYCLDGPEIEHLDGFNTISDSIVTGSIQVPGTRKPIVLMADRQTTGGYPKIATTATASLPTLAQLKPGDRLSFNAVDVAGARALLAEQVARLGRIATNLRPVSRDPRDLTSEALLAHNLIDGVVGPDA